MTTVDGPELACTRSEAPYASLGRSAPACAILWPISGYLGQQSYLSRGDRQRRRLQEQPFRSPFRLPHSDFHSSSALITCKYVTTCS